MCNKIQRRMGIVCNKIKRRRGVSVDRIEMRVLSINLSLTIKGSVNIDMNSTANVIEVELIMK